MIVLTGGGPGRCYGCEKEMPMVAHVTYLFGQQNHEESVCKKHLWNLVKNLESDPIARLVAEIEIERLN